MIERAIEYITTDIWRIRLSDLTRSNAFFLRHFRIILLTIRGFLEDNCLLRASALTFYSLLSIGPVVALTFGIAKGFGLQQRLQSEILEKIPAQEEVLNQILEYADVLLTNTKGGVIAGIGVILLFWSVLKVLNHIERSFNEIWYITESRSWKRKLSNYLSFIVIAPILLLIYSSIPVFITTQISLIAGKITILQKISPLILLPLKLLPYILVWGVFTFIYLLIPNTRVSFKSGLLGGIIAGTIYLLVQWLYINFQVGVARYNPIYGSLAALPLLLVWLNLGWIILLIGAEYSFAHQNVEAYEFEPDYANVSPYLKKLMTLQIAQLIAKRFSKVEPPLSAVQISQSLDMPIRLAEKLLGELTGCGLVSNVQQEEYAVPVYQPASDIGLWTVKYLSDALEKCGVNQIPIAQTREFETLSKTVEQIDTAMEASPANKLLKDI